MVELHAIWPHHAGGVWSIFSKAGLGAAYYHITTAALCALTLGTELLLLEIGWNKAGQQIFYNPVNYGGGKVFK